MAHYKAKFNDTIIYVDISAQKLYLVRGDEIIKAYTVSTSKHGSGFQQGSFMTPLGIHKIKEKIGAGEKTGTVFDERVPTKKIARIYTDTTDVASDLITTRILWLEGLEDKVNRGSQKDSYDRFIYIHGTHEEGLIGKPSSLGCVRMKNDDIIQLFDLIRVGTFVIISAAL
jgi:lipoprotein-anchoring transpeptidase ErfK/SrfK